MIKVRELRKVYRIGKEKVAALGGINLDIPKGQFCCIVGASGSGKSTLLNQLAGLEKPTKGSVVINGEEISQMNENQLAVFRQNNLGFVFQSYNLLPTMTATENVALPLMFKGQTKKVREKTAQTQLKQMGLGKRLRHKPTEMSGGQQQRVGIARAFVAKPKVIFADEPTGNLDSKTTAEVMATILQMVQEYQITFVMVTHERDLSAYADRIITLKDGMVKSDELVTDAHRAAFALSAQTKDAHARHEAAAVAPPQPLPDATPAKLEPALFENLSQTAEKENVTHDEPNKIEP